MNTNIYTPLMKQYNEVKQKHQDAMLLFRLGDFYELFYEDAKIASRELNITLTARNKEKGEDVPMAGFPHHSASPYIAKLIDKGYKVAICEQMEDAKNSKGIVKRDVTRIVTPGTFADVEYMDEKQNSYVVHVSVADSVGALSYIDVTTGEFRTLETGSLQELINTLYKICSKEVISSGISDSSVKEELYNYCRVNKVYFTEYAAVDNAQEFLKSYFKVLSLSAFGLENKKHSIASAATLLKYVLELAQYNNIAVKNLNYINSDQFLFLNFSTQQNLELFNNITTGSREGSLISVLDITKTAIGARMLRKFIREPLINIDKILRRQNDVESFVIDPLTRDEVRTMLKTVYDLERLVGRVIIGSNSARDLVAIKQTLLTTLALINALKGKFVKTDKSKILEVCKLLEATIEEAPPLSVHEGGIIKHGYNEELDKLHNISESGKEFLLNLEQKERERTKIKNLKISYNKIFGYFIEITRSYAHLVPAEYIRKQTLSNAERFITPELKEYEDNLLSAKDRMIELEYSIFKEVSNAVAANSDILQHLAIELAYVDVITTLATVAIDNRYVKPDITMEPILLIENGRHPVVEKMLNNREFIANSAKLDNGQLTILTGPNMSGKSTYMKQIALIILMAQMGCYIPASQAKIGLVDKIFTRIGASDDLFTGQSTFMVEMNEVSNILHNATERSFIILDEVGRGTSTFDGIAIAKAVTEHIHNVIKAKTIFATHYHELTTLENELERVINFRFEVSEKNDQILFLKKVVKGGADKSYGVEVARLAGLPLAVLNRSHQLLKELELKSEMFKKSHGGQLPLTALAAQKIESTASLDEGQRRLAALEKENEILKMAVNRIKELDIDNITPMQALVKLSELKKDS